MELGVEGLRPKGRGPTARHHTARRLYRIATVNQQTAPQPLQWGKVLVIGFLCLAAYGPALNNGFISDDFPNLESAARFQADPLYLFEIQPQNFRMTVLVRIGCRGDKNQEGCVATFKKRQESD